MKSEKDQLLLDEILEEVVAAEVDQMLMVSRSEASHLYLLSHGRIKKGITFERDITKAFVDYFTEKDFPDPMKASVACEMNVSPAGMLGQCLSITIKKKTPIDA